MIRPGEVVKLSSRFDTKGETPVVEDEVSEVTTSPRPKARPEGLGAPVVRSNRDPVKVAVTTDKTASNIKDIQQALTDMGYKPNGVDGAMGGGTKRALRKFQAANDLPITGELTQEVADLLTNGTSAVYPDMPVPSAPVEDIFTDFNMSVFENEVGKIESKNRYNIKGGAGDHYDGRYQMGAAAKKDAARALGITLGHDAASRKAFRNDPDLQDRAFKAYTEKNHKHLTINSEKYRNMTDQEKLGILGYAHNQGATAAEEYLFTGQVGADAFGTKGTKYTDTIAKALGN
jgi:peptidoglycan hydrolase-like protein with peptidoglycan-binding domain